MKTIYNIAKTELKNLFFSPIAWLILIIFTIQIAFPYLKGIERIVKNALLGYGSSNITGGLFCNKNSILNQVINYSYLYIPLLTMGLMSREIASGSIKLLFSSPVSSKQIVFGKFFAMMIYSLVLITPLILFTIFSAFTVKDFDFYFVLSGVIGVYLLICSYSAIGLFMSSLTSYQVVAAIGTLAVLAGLNFVGEIGQGIDFVRDLTYWLSIKGRAQEMVTGLISSETILYFIAVIGMFLSFSIIKFQSGRLKNNLIIAGKYLAVVFACLIIGYISSRPIMKGYADMTSTKMNTLTKNSQDIINQLDGGMTITTYVNLLDRNSRYGMPQAINKDKKRFEKYLRFKPEIEMKYVYYWDHNYDPFFYRRYPNLSDEEIAKKICETWGYDFNDFLRPEQIREIIDLSGETNRFVRVIERDNGQKTWLRIYDDMYVHPFEPEISAALKRFIVETPKIGFLTGHGERAIYEYGDRDYSRATGSKTFRNSLINQGFDYCAVDFEDGDVSEDINILVISDIKKKFSENDKKHLRNFIGRGGNLVIAGEVRRAEQMKELVGMFGVKFKNGIIVRPNNRTLPTIAYGNVPKESGKKMSFILDYMANMGEGVAMTEALALDYNGCKEKGYEAIPLVVTDNKGSWNELETTDFVDGELSLNNKIGEVEEAKVLSVALKRKVNNKEQKIIILGDADCISNSGISSRYRGVVASNFKFFTSMFHWLSDKKMPIDTRRPVLTDNKMYLGMSGYLIAKTFFVWLIPLGLILAYILIWLKRFKR